MNETPIRFVICFRNKLQNSLTMTIDFGNIGVIERKDCNAK